MPSYFSTVRSVSIRLAPTGLGWHVLATSRGYFPIAENACLPLSLFAGADAPAPEAPSQAGLEILAASKDSTSARHLAAAILAIDAPLDRIKTLNNFLNLSNAAFMAARFGFFAAPDQREALWLSACRILDRILSTPEAQPKASGVVWPASLAAARYREVLEAYTYLWRFLGGDFATATPRHAFAPWFVPSYFGLPEIKEPVLPRASLRAPESFRLPSLGLSESWENAAPIHRGQGGGFPF